MAWFRTLVSIVALVALLGAACVPAAHAMRTTGPAATAVMASAEPCPATHGPKRCELKALPIVAGEPVVAGGPLAAPPTGTAGADRGVWPEVEPHPPRS